ncbi:serine hydrolase domain-containing protein [Listeria ilorinensis]|uniref:serine hydrolase domain-containing protein n=1 Tax=Listeria ilorinensis TaxID=2867439 RepID=UPI003EBD196A
MNRSMQNKQRKRRQLFFSILLICLLLVLIFGVVQIFTPQTFSNATEKTQKKMIKKQQSTTKLAESPKKEERFIPTETIVQNQEIDQYLQQIGFNGTAMVVREGKVIIDKGYGLANREQQVENRTDTGYYIGSAQKAFIATAILQLEEAGKLNIDDPISQYLPDFPNGQNIKLRHLLTHTSGIVGHTEGQGAITPEELVRDIEKQGIKRQPGKWNYLDSNYTVLAYLVEKISDTKLSDYIQTHIFDPCGMKGAGFYQTFTDQKYPSTGYYVAKDGSYGTPSLPDLSQLYGVGNMYMRAIDMYLFDKGIAERKLINEESYQKMFTKGSNSGYGFGFYVDPGSYNNHGILNGWNASNSFSHSGKTFVVLLSNVQNNIASFGKVNNEIYQLLNKADA